MRRTGGWTTTPASCPTASSKSANSPPSASPSPRSLVAPVRIKMLDWISQTDQIGSHFGAMIRQYGVDPSRPQMEYYRSLSELHLLLPVPA